MANFISVGSCLSALPGVFLMGDYKWRRLNNAKVDRSDLFVADFIDRTGNMPPREEIVAFAQPLPEHEKVFFDNLAACYPDTIGLFECRADCRPLRDTLESQDIDVILMDNMVETYTQALTLDAPSGHRFTSVLPFHLCRNKDEILARNPVTTAPLPAEQAVANWARIIGLFRDALPRADLVFVCSPYCLSPADPGRYRRSVDFYLLFREQADALGVKLIPPLDVEARYTKLPDDDAHFDNVIYRAMAGHIVLGRLASLPGTSRPYRLPDRVFWT